MSQPEARAQRAASAPSPPDDGERLGRAVALLAQTLEGCAAAINLRLTAIESALVRLAEIQEARLDPEERASLKLTNLRASVASLQTIVEQAHAYTPRK